MVLFLYAEFAEDIDKRPHFHRGIPAGDGFIGESVECGYFLVALFRRIVGQGDGFAIFQFALEDAPSDPSDYFTHPADGFAAVVILGDGIDGFFVITLHLILYRFVSDLCTQGQETVAIRDSGLVVSRKVDTVGCPGLHLGNVTQVECEIRQKKGIGPTLCCPEGGRE
ncbi:hypothetical protein NXY11_04480 [Parabacteroides faecis]|uniref:hypothetical protein n=1 Tax=Parabacteroides faecis TaxID=1217282 RepID=UPI0021643976|nr:hypothetical protein [Parabacteroides faecis]UVQ47508.1 hypothetical protein NXY11_04480 [Parabacteroides faecis]